MAEIKLLDSYKCINVQSCENLLSCKRGKSLKMDTLNENRETRLAQEKCLEPDDL